jgi:hypothetical protein
MEHALEPALKPDSRRPRSRAAGAPGSASELHPVHQLQQQAGNQAMQQLLRSGAIRAKLEVSHPSDPEEQEADSTADRIMRSHASAGAVAASACTCSEEESCACSGGQKIARSAAGAASAAPHGFLRSLHSSAGQPLDRHARAFFEPRFGRDLSNVRVHSDATAAASARAINAHAFTAGSDIFFAPGRYAPSSEDGQRLLAHELTHTAQHKDSDSHLYRDLDPKLQISMTPEYAQDLSDEDLASQEAALSAYLAELDEDAEDELADSGDPERDAVAANLRTLRQEKKRREKGTACGGQDQKVKKYQVQMLTLDQFQAMTGQAADQLPEGKYTSASATQAAVPGAARGMATAPMPKLPVPENATGIIWEGSHVTDFGVVEGSIVGRGFRAPIPVHLASDAERALKYLGRKPGGRVFTQLLNTGGRDLGGMPLTWPGRMAMWLSNGRIGQYRNDWMFPYMPGARAVYRTDLPPGGAEEFIEFMKGKIPEYKDIDYRYSTPPRDNPAWARAFGENPNPPDASNCINVPSEVHDRALGGRKLVLDEGGNLVDIVSGEPGSKPGMAKNMDTYVNQSEEFFASRGLTVKPTAKAMWARAGVGFIRVGGYVLMVYGAYETYKRIDEASPGERPIVEAEEAGSWVGGFIGNAMASALGGAFICAETGPGAVVCALACGVVGGVTGSVIGKEAMHDLAENLSHITPQLILETSTQMFGSPQARQADCQMKEIEGIYDPQCQL